jgi:hypothetical protein
MLEEERKGYVEDKRKTEKFFDISLVAYTFIRFGLTIEAKLEEFNNEINSKLNEKESVG